MTTVKKNYEYILFDLDGTLTDSGLGITNSVIYALKKFGIEVKDRSEVYPFIGPPLIDSFMRFFNMSKEDALICVEYYREYFSVTGLFENEVYDGIEELLSDVRKSGKKMIVATSKPYKFTERILEHFDLTKYFDFIAGSTMDEKRNTKEAVIRYAMDKWCIDPEKSLMIGDREYDVYGAKAVGMDCLGVLYGYGSREELEEAGATYIVNDIKELRKIIKI